MTMREIYLFISLHQSGCFSLPKEGTPPYMLPQLPVFRNVTPGRSYILDQVIAPSCSWSAWRSFISTGYTFYDSDCPSVVTSPRYVFRPSVFAFSYVPDNVCHTTLFPDPVCTLSVLQVTPIMILSIFLWVVISFSSWVLLNGHVSQSYVITESIHSLNAFLFSLIGTFLSRMMVSSLQYLLHPCPILIFIACAESWSLVTIWPIYTYLSTSSILFPSTITSSLLTCLLHITLVFPRCILRSTGLLMPWIY